MQTIERTITSNEVAEMVGRSHDNVLKDIRNIVKQIGDVKTHESSITGEVKNHLSYFIESTYLNSQNKELPNYMLTKKGCELFSTRMTGAKGTQFAMGYIDHFNQMENHIKQVETIQKPVTQTELLKMTAGSLIEMDTRVTELEENAPLSPGDYSYISRIVHQKVRQVITERQLNPNTKQRQLLYKELNGEIKQITNTPTRSQLRRQHFAIVTGFVRDWQPSNAALVIYKQLELVESEVG
ncbi:Rha family transcriptional regulator [Brochothrix thermosphacta]|uniref:Rha family transcriptional regulator n=1 Tax=Brochothrix thermosphacta TaxID=2756 RepID=UPI0039AFEDCA